MITLVVCLIMFNFHGSNYTWKTVLYIKLVTLLIFNWKKFDGETGILIIVINSEKWLQIVITKFMISIEN